MNSSPASRIGNVASVDNLIFCIAAHFDQAGITISSKCLTRTIDCDISDCSIGASVAVIPDCHFLAVRVYQMKVGKVT